MTSLREGVDAPGPEMESESSSRAPSDLAPASAAGMRTSGKNWRRAARCVWHLLWGTALCQTVAGSLIIIGWTQRFAQRVVLKEWWKRAEVQAGAGGKSFEEFAAADSRTASQVCWPNWILGQKSSAVLSPKRRFGERGWLTGRMRRVFHSLGLNLKRGVQAILNTWVFTLPGCVLFLFAWYDGWNNSFNKGYEQAVVGPLTGIAGMALFIVAMFYVPMAQMRQAATGQWRSFYDFGVVWAVIRRRWLGCVVLAFLYAAAAFPLMILKTAPGFFPQINPKLAALSAPEALEFLNLYFLWCGLIVFPAFVALRWAAAKIYASGLLEAVQVGALPEETLADIEWESLHRLDLLVVRSEPKRPLWWRWAAWFGSRAGRFTGGVLILLLWFSFLAQNIVAEFLHFHPKIGWLNHPLVQLPWFRFVPPDLKKEAKPIELARRASDQVGSR